MKKSIKIRFFLGLISLVSALSIQAGRITIKAALDRARNSNPSIYLEKKSLLLDRLQSLEIIVGDGTSDDNTKKIAEKLGARVYQNPRSNQNIAKNRNLGAKHAKGEVLIFCDADTKLKDPKKSIKRINEIFSDKEIVAGMMVLDIFPKQKKFVDVIFHSGYNCG